MFPKTLKVESIIAIMGQRGKLRTTVDSVIFFCPGCEDAHVVRVSGHSPWEFNQDYDRPTFKPSVKVTGTEIPTDEEIKLIMSGVKVPPRARVCHSFVTDGHIQFLNDCTHSLKGKLIPLPELPDWLKD